MKFKYKAYDKENNLVEGELEADNRNKAHLFLVEQGYEVLSVDDVSAAANKKVSALELVFGNVSLQQKMMFVKHLSLMVKSGMPINESVNILASDSKGKMKGVLFKILQSIESGNHLADSLAKFPRVFDRFFISLVNIGEQSGTLEQSLINLATHLKKSHDLTSKIRGALLYPAIIFTAVIGLGFTLGVFVLPKLMGFFESLNTELPLSTKILLFMSAFFVSNWKLLLAIIIILVLGIGLTKRFTPVKAVLHWLYLKLPIVKIFTTNTNLAGFCRAMSLMLQSGITLDNSIEIARSNTANFYYDRALGKLLEMVKKGESLGVVMERYHQLFPVTVSRMIKVGEKSGNLAETFDYLATFYEDEVDNLSKNLSGVIEPILLVIIGALVAFVALSIITPIYELTSNVAK